MPSGKIIQESVLRLGENGIDEVGPAMWIVFGRLGGQANASCKDDFDRFTVLGYRFYYKFPSTCFVKEEETRMFWQRFCTYCMHIINWAMKEYTRCCSFGLRQQ